MNNVIKICDDLRCSSDKGFILLGSTIALFIILSVFSIFLIRVVVKGNQISSYNLLDIRTRNLSQSGLDHGIQLFKTNNTVFLGGSLIKHGGQNPIEAARNGCKIIYGPHVKNFKEVYKLLEKNKVSYKVNNIEQLTNKVGILIKKNKESKNLEDKINKLGKRILEKTLFEFKFYLNKI